MAIATVEKVVTRATVNPVVPGPTLEIVVLCVTEKAVGARAADNVLNVRKRVSDRTITGRARSAATEVNNNSFGCI